jgi:uncharacterized membrane protein
VLAAKTFFIALLFVIILDLLWVGLIANSFYKTEVRPILKMDGDSIAPRWYAVVPVYILLALGFALFVVPHASSALHAAGLGALLGLVIYGVYDFTNLALLSQWTLRVALVDTAWGAALGALVSAGTYAVQLRI